MMGESLSPLDPTGSLLLQAVYTYIVSAMNRLARACKGWRGIFARVVVIGYSARVE